MLVACVSFHYFSMALSFLKEEERASLLSWKISLASRPSSSALGPLSTFALAARANCHWNDTINHAIVDATDAPVDGPGIKATQARNCAHFSSFLFEFLFLFLFLSCAPGTRALRCANAHAHGPRAPRLRRLLPRQSADPFSHSKQHEIHILTFQFLITSNSIQSLIRSSIHSFTQLQGSHARSPFPSQDALN